MVISSLPHKPCSFVPSSAPQSPFPSRIPSGAINQGVLLSGPGHPTANSTYYNMHMLHDVYSDQRVFVMKYMQHYIQKIVSYVDDNIQDRQCIISTECPLRDFQSNPIPSTYSLRCAIRLRRHYFIQFHLLAPHCWIVFVLLSLAHQWIVFFIIVRTRAFTGAGWITRTHPQRMSRSGFL